MAMGMEITDRGSIDLVELQFLYLQENMNEAIAAELDSIWQQIKELAIEMCPKETGALASSIELENEGGSGRMGVSQTSGEFYSNAIFAGNDSTFNAEGHPTSQYVVPVHEGHRLPNGMFWEGTPFLTDALDAYDAELQAAVSTALAEMGF
jgi:hypothetical protein